MLPASATQAGVDGPSRWLRRGSVLMVPPPKPGPASPQVNAHWTIPVLQKPGELRMVPARYCGILTEVCRLLPFSPRREGGPSSGRTPAAFAACPTVPAQPRVKCVMFPVENSAARTRTGSAKHNGKGKVWTAVDQKYRYF